MKYNIKSTYVHVCKYIYYIFFFHTHGVPFFESSSHTLAHWKFATAEDRHKKMQQQRLTTMLELQALENIKLSLWVQCA